MGRKFFSAPNARRRRYLGAALAGAALPALSVRAQAKRARVALLITTERKATVHLLEAFTRQLADSGWMEGGNLELVTREGFSKPENFERLAGELVALQPDVLVAPYWATALVAKKLTQRIPIIFTLADDPVEMGLVASLARPGGNVTGVAMHGTGLWAKRLELAKELVPGARKVGGILAFVPRGQFPAPGSAGARRLEALRQHAKSLGMESTYAWAPQPEDMAEAIQELVRNRADLYYGPIIYWSHMKKWVPHLTVARLPSVFEEIEYVEAGGLLWHGTRLAEYWRQCAVYVDRILRGAKPAELPVEAPTKIQTVLNLKTARALGLKVPRSFMIHVDQVIE